MLLELRCARCGCTYTVDRRDLIRGVWRLCPECRDGGPPGALAGQPDPKPARRELDAEAA